MEHKHGVDNNLALALALAINPLILSPIAVLVVMSSLLSVGDEALYWLTADWLTAVTLKLYLCLGFKFSTFKKE